MTIEKQTTQINPELKTNNGEVSPKTADQKLFLDKNILISSGIHFGHITRRWNPAMKPFIYTTKNKIHYLDLTKTNAALKIAFKAIQQIILKGGKFLFVGTTNPSKLTIKENALRSDSYYVNERWLGGLLTNFRTINNSINRMKQLERMQEQNFAGYSKKEGVLLKKELKKLEATLGGIKNMRKAPEAIFVTSLEAEQIAIKEAKKLKIPVFGIVDTNVDPSKIQFMIPGNDDANVAIALVTTAIADSICFAKGMPTSLLFKTEAEAKIIGIDENLKLVPKDVELRRGKKYVSGFTLEKKSKAFRGAEKPKFVRKPRPSYNQQNKQNETEESQVTKPATTETSSSKE